MGPVISPPAIHRRLASVVAIRTVRGQKRATGTLSNTLFDIAKYPANADNTMTTPSATARLARSWVIPARNGRISQGADMPLTVMVHHPRCDVTCTEPRY